MEINISSQDFNYLLEICVPEEFPQIIPVESRITIGSSASADVSIDGLSPNHCIFKLNNGILSVLNASGKKETFLGKQKLQHGKMYIIDKGDHLKLEDVEIIISKEKVAPPKEIKKEEATEITKPKVARDKTKTQTSLNLLKQEHKTQKHAGVDQLKTLIGHTLEGPKPGILLRLNCWLADLALTYALIYTVIPLLGLQNGWNEVVDILKTAIAPLLSLIPEQGNKLLSSLPTSIYHFMVGWLAIEWIGNIIFSVPLTYAILGMKSTGTGISKRLKAFVRAPLALTDLLIIVNLQTLFKKKTLKEYITFSEIYIANQVLKRVGVSLLLPVIIIGSLLSPVLTKTSALDALQKEITLTNHKAIQGIKQAATNINFDSRYFQISAAKVIPQKTKIVPHAGKRRLWLIDPQSNRELSFSLRGSKIPFKEIIATARTSDPFFHFHYPALITTGKWDPNKQDQLNQLIKGLLKLNLQTLPKYVTTHGPFVASHFRAKELLLNSLPDSISWEILPSGQVMQTLARKKGQQIKGFFVIDYPQGQYYQITGHFGAKKFNKEFSTLLLRKAKWERPNIPKEVNGISFLDFMIRIKNDPNQQLCQQFHRFYRQLTTDAISSKNPIYQATTLLSLEDTIKNLGNHNQKNPSTSLTTLLQNLQMLEIKYKDDIDLANIKELIKKDLVK